jgi:hypothetical protein
VFDFSSQPRWPNWRWLLHELKFYAAAGAISGLGFVVISALVYGSDWVRVIASCAALAAVWVAIARARTMSWEWGIFKRAKKWLLDAAKLWERSESWKPALPPTEPFSRPLASPDSWALVTAR